MNAKPSREEVLFLAALQFATPAERDAFLRKRCGNDDALRERVLVLLAANEAAGGFTAAPAAAPATLKIGNTDLVATITEQAGDCIGPYKLREKIGEGGCGVVYVAEQEKPVRRRVALKVIKLGMDTKQVVARFEAERQALAMMDHPNIAKVLDAGATEAGRPYFVMELVRGIRITEYCDQNNLPTKNRLDLFIKVCHAIQHAHQKGLIHRDIKPSNILVTLHDGVPVPKVIDFGIAKATEGRLSDLTVYTELHQFIGTPAYMSPEQAEMSGLDIDTRSDIYALGVLLYELLTGRTPFDAKELVQAGIDEIRRTIREVEPPRPSTRLSTMVNADLTLVAKRHGAEPSKFSKLVRGDLDWIAMTCLEKDRTRRYETANGLAMDIQRHLNNEPIRACPPSTVYRFQKLIRRNKLAFAAGTAIAASLVIGITASVWQAVRANRALSELRASAPALAEQARAMAAREQFDDAIAKLDDAIKLRPDIAEYLMAKGDLLQCKLKLVEAAAVYREALRVKPGLARAEMAAKLCDELLAAPLTEQGKLTRESLAKLHLAMQRQQRPAAELMPVARLLGEEKKLLVDYWLTRLRDLPVSADRPLKERLAVRDNGRLALDLSNTKVSDLSPLASAPLGELNVSMCNELSDLSPLRDMRTLEKLEIDLTKVTDLSALSALPLKSLFLRGCAVSDLKPLRQVPLEAIDLGWTRVTDISPLIGMPIKHLELAMAPVVDFSPLAQFPLEKCYLQHNRITDLSVLRGKALKELALWGCLDARNYAVLPEVKTLELLLLPSTYRTLPGEDYEAIGALRNHPKLHQLGAAIMSGADYAATGSTDDFWKDWDREQIFVPALRRSGINFSLQKLLSGSYALSVKNQQPLRDLSILKGAPISKLEIIACQITNLAPLHDLPLEFLNISDNPIIDLNPLREMEIQTLNLIRTKVSDLSPLTNLPLKNLYISGCPNATNVAALAEISTLEQLAVPTQARNIGALRKLLKLKRLGFDLAAKTSEDALPIPNATVEEFWTEFDADPWIDRLRNAGIRASIIKRLEDGTWELNLSDAKISDLTLLKGAPISKLYLNRTPVADLAPLRGMPLKALNLDGTRVTDLSLANLQSAPISELSLGNTGVEDLSSLRGMRLKYLMLWKTRVTDLTPLNGMPLEELSLDASPIIDLSPLQGMRISRLHMRATKVTDLSPLRGMPLTRLLLHECADLTDLSPLREAKELTELTLPPNARNIEILRFLPKLRRLGFKDKNLEADKTAAEFWKEYDAQQKAVNLKP